MKQILLNKSKALRSRNVDNKISTELFTERKLLPTDSLSETVDAYSEYVKEKDASNIYRLMFTINPVCSNILFNALTEIVYREGSDDIKVIDYAQYIDNPVLNEYYSKYKFTQTAWYNMKLPRFEWIRDTACSHPIFGGFTYHCGLDIFNNHTLRRKEFAVVNDRTNAINPRDKNFNTLADYLRDSTGREVEEKLFKIKAKDLTPSGHERTYQNNMDTGATVLHLYKMDSVDSFQRAINDKLVEADGWVGFINPSTLDVPNVTLNGTQYTINKCMNDRSAGEFVDMYPDRTLYSFIPKVNPYRKRLEKNWDYCLTYPSENVYDNNIVQSDGGANGLKGRVISSLSNTIFDNTQKFTEDTIVYIKTQVTNTLQRGDQINITVINTGNVSSETYYPITVESVGYLGEDTAHVFSVKAGELYDVFSRVAYVGDTREDMLDDDGYLRSKYEIRIRKFVNGIDCKYYFRKFRKLPDYSSTINKLAFSENIFSDKAAQILYNEDIDTTGLKDNQGRPLSELYLTIVKRNKGYEEWLNEYYLDSSIEYSHCFGAVTSGLDLAPDENDYNVRKQFNNRYQYPGGVSCLETDITVEDFDEFLGDLVEFSPYEVKETILENVYHRFNTIQREGDLYKNGIKHEEIDSDDYDILTGFTAETKTMTLTEKSCHEGYFYKPHYRIPLRQYSEQVKQGCHTKMVFTSIEYNGGTYVANTAVNYYLVPGDTLYAYHKITGERVEGEVKTVGGRNFTEITFTLSSGVDNIVNYSIFKKNSEMPDYAYDLMDATGRYLWREELSDKDLIIGDELYNAVFTNGANYRHLNINFYLRRQDPTGEYGLNTEGTADSISFASTGNVKDLTTVEYINEGEGTIC